ncbi:hypothetical protein PanWU01x14_011570 [Parasponia andersonii]|uniref:Uncharacterized protein n=1 Tax=Parasponia andersonii TaxID=3476 RepID=A0A2P5E1K7_PARAD|nr:hypothetical protein PanWU01x14_011570 [Parasponia andersonii]
MEKENFRISKQLKNIMAMSRWSSLQTPNTASVEARLCEQLQQLRWQNVFICQQQKAQDAASSKLAVSKGMPLDQPSQLSQVLQQMLQIKNKGWEVEAQTGLIPKKKRAETATGYQ